MSELLARTQSVCPVCLKSIDARRELRGSEGWLVKQCPEHGVFQTLIWRGPPHIQAWSRPKTPYKGGPRVDDGGRGCPWDCGLCGGHNQRTCTAILEVTARCDLGCPVCFASSDVQAPPDPGLDELGGILQGVWQRTGGCNLQLSGGEPSMRSDLCRVVEMAREIGFGFVQLNTNGLKLAADADLAPRLASAGLASVFMQFDGLRPSDHLALRGRDLCDVKQRAIENAGRAGLGVVLVPTLAARVNTDQLWEMVRFGVKHSPVVRGVHFQPMAFLGRYPLEPGPRDRVTLPEIMQGLEEQSRGHLKASHFAPPGCEHSLCSFSGSYVVNPDCSLTQLGAPQTCDCKPRPAVQGALRSIESTARQWSGQLLPVLAPDPPAAPDAPAGQDEDPFGVFVQRARTHGFSISGMAFQDAWSLDLERLQGCCIHVAREGGRLVPFCAYNLSSSGGRTPHRDQAWD